MAMPARRRGDTSLTADDWADAALDAIGGGGLAAVAIEPLAQHLGVTKGSFYWHYPNRAALVEAALARWEQVHTEAVIDMIESEPDPRARLVKLLRAVVGVAPTDRVEIALLASADHPAVAAATARVTERRVAYVAELYQALGDHRAVARRRAVIAVATYLGHLQLARAAPSVLPEGKAALARHLDQLVATLVDAPA
jgi:AcrR family transcriptional regulator